MESAALEFLEGLTDVPPLAFDLAAHYPDEMALPEVQRIHLHYQGIDTSALFATALARSGYRGRSFLYGDTAPPVMVRLLERIGASSRDTFYDLGCGCGMAVLTASLLVGRAVGVDLVPGAVEFCRLSARVLGIENVAFRTGDLLKTDLSPATIVFVAATSFEFLDALGEHLLTARPGAVVVSVTHAFDRPGLRRVKTVPMQFAWTGRGQGYPFRFHVHRRVP